jgi:hypothetical protein
LIANNVFKPEWVFIYIVYFFKMFSNN